MTNKGSGGKADGACIFHVYFMCISLAINDEAKDFL